VFAAPPVLAPPVNAAPPPVFTAPGVVNNNNSSNSGFGFNQRSNAPSMGMPGIGEMVYDSQRG
jgi:hypothetical protein